MLLRIINQKVNRIQSNTFQHAVSCEKRNLILKKSKIRGFLWANSCCHGRHLVPSKSIQNQFKEWGQGQWQVWSSTGMPSGVLWQLYWFTHRGKKTVQNLFSLPALSGSPSVVVAHQYSVQCRQDCQNSNTGLCKCSAHYFLPSTSVKSANLRILVVALEHCFVLVPLLTTTPILICFFPEQIYAAEKRAHSSFSYQQK